MRSSASRVSFPISIFRLLAILARRSGHEAPFNADVADMEFITRASNCGQCANNCERILVYRDGKLIDAWGNRCERGAIKVK